LRAAMEAALGLTGREGAELSLVFLRDDAMRPLNRDWRGKVKTTDVLSFPQPETGGARALGDIVVSVDAADRQARERGHGLDAEFLRLLVHGYLHLLGYDHERGPEEARLMRREERRLLREIRWQGPRTP
ncbi:MAG: rRNA maturation RNase YbeY, partial [Candidatus Methylomirabilis sp.]|nr:rRNA maturation RNase YbeY [Deltaproteobacteria bacterium]